MGIESSCGALTGAVMVLSHLFVKERAHESDYIGNLTQEFLLSFEEKMTSIECNILKDKYGDPVKGCRSIIYTASQILEEIVEKELKK